MKYFYLKADNTKIYTSKEMYDSQVEYYAIAEAFTELHGVLYFENGIEPAYTDFAMKHIFEAPEDANAIVYKE